MPECQKSLSQAWPSLKVLSENYNGAISLSWWFNNLLCIAALYNYVIVHPETNIIRFRLYHSYNFGEWNGNLVKVSGLYPTN